MIFCTAMRYSMMFASRYFSCVSNHLCNKRKSSFSSQPWKVPNDHVSSLSSQQAWARDNTTVSVSARSFGTTTSSSSSSITYSGRRKNESYCVDLVKLRDREAYYCGLLLPKQSRDAYFALRAFNAEIASIKDHHRGSSHSPTSSSSALALQLRMQWWRDAIQSIYESNNTVTTTVVIDNPIVKALAAANAKSRFTRRFLDRIIDAREADLEIQQYQTVAALSHYAESTVCSLLYLTLESLLSIDQKKDETNLVDGADEMAYHAGIGIGFTTALRSTPYLLSNQQEMPIPVELLGEGFRINSNAGDNIETNPQFRSACQQLAWYASEHLIRARDLQGSLQSVQRPVFLTMLPSINYLSKLETADYNVFSPTALSAGAGSDRLTLLLLLARSWISGVY